MKDPQDFDFLFEDCDREDPQPAQEWLHGTLRLRNPIIESFPTWNSDRLRVIEFLEFYLSSPEVFGWRKYYLAELIIDSLADALGDRDRAEDEKDGFETYEPLTFSERTEIAQLMRRLRHDRRFMHFSTGPIRDAFLREMHPQYEEFYHEVFGKDDEYS